MKISESQDKSQFRNQKGTPPCTRLMTQSQTLKTDQEQEEDEKPPHQEQEREEKDEKPSHQEQEEDSST